MQWQTPTALDYFALLVAHDEGFPLTEAAAAVAQAEEPSLDLQAVLARIDVMAVKLKGRIPGDAGALHRVKLLHRHFYDELGFSGNVNDYYSPANSYLHEVLRTRRGIPITLAVLYMELAQRIGLKASGVSFPGHFLIRLNLPQGDALVDPLNGLSLSREVLEERLDPFLSPADRRAAGPLGAKAALQSALEPASPREIIARMLRNLEAIHRAAQDWPRLLAVQERLVILQPSAWDWRRERGLTLAELGQTGPAMDDLAEYLAHQPDARDLDSIAARLKALKQAGPPRWH